MADRVADTAAAAAAVEPAAGPAGAGEPPQPPKKQTTRTLSPFKRWLLQGHVREPEGPHQPEGTAHHTHPWWQVMCLTGVDYFSTLGYQPGIAALAAGALSPLATLILVLLTLFGALPIYGRVATESPHGEGSIAMLERLLAGWRGKLFVLCLLGFVATDFVITITLSAADATAHIVENPLAPHFLHDHKVGLTLLLIGLLAAVFLKGFKEAVGIAVFLVAVYLALNAVVVGRGLFEVVTHPQTIPDWREALFAKHGTNPFVMVGIALLLFPRLALGLSGFETGVAVMPLVKGDPDDTHERPAGRIRNTRKVLLSAAIIMSVYLLTSSVVTTLLIPAHEFRPATHVATVEQLRERLVGKKTQEAVVIADDVVLFQAGRTISAADVNAAHILGQLDALTTAAGEDRGEEAKAGAASGRALAYLAHKYLGPVFGTIYDLSTVLILWFAGASAMAGLLNIVPRYLPRYGMAPDWTRAVRPLVLVFTAIAFAVTVIFKADVDAQGGAYATGVLVLMTSAAVAVTLSAWRNREPVLKYLFALIAAVFAYTTVVNVIERPDGIKIAGFFIAAIVVTSLVSRVFRSTELRVAGVELDRAARRFLEEAAAQGEIRLVTNRRQTGDETEYRIKERNQRQENHLPTRDQVLFLEVELGDTSAFAEVLEVRGVEVTGERRASQLRGQETFTYRVLRVRGASAVPNAIAAVLLHVRDVTGKIPHAYFTWAEGNPLAYVLRFVVLGQGDTAPVTHEVIRQAEPDPERRPALHVGGWG
ncbi:MAG TPA: hypothetical protein VM490_18165 [Armatimonadaceae bacterium]|nr:hypothetical protein [Armatimonadaceae bacterium]